MSYDVVVVGGGIGGLTVAALLSARGQSVCLLERQSQVGGCISRVEFSGYDFDPGMGLYPAWGADETWQVLFAELPVSIPVAREIEEDYVIRFEDNDVSLKRDDLEFFDQLERAFPECSKAAIQFYSEIIQLNNAWSPSALYGPAVQSFGSKLRNLWRRSNTDVQLQSARTKTVSSLLGNASDRFRKFVDVQLKTLLQTNIGSCSLLPAAITLCLPREISYRIEGGIATVPERLSQSIKAAGGVVRLNTTVLRLAYDSVGNARGVVLLSGETVSAKRAIVSNLSLWDTYGKLIGLNQTPTAIKTRLQKTRAKGAYLIYALLEHSALARLPGSHLMVAGVDEDSEENLGSEIALTVAAAAAKDKHPTTIKTGTEVSPWFSFQETEEDYEHWDQTALERFWARIHRALPELGSGIEVIETANPRTYYDLTRRKLGMVLGVEPTPETLDWCMGHGTTVPNLFRVGDTTVPASNLLSVTQSASELANNLSK